MSWKASLPHGPGRLTQAKQSLRNMFHRNWLRAVSDCNGLASEEFRLTRLIISS